MQDDREKTPTLRVAVIGAGPAGLFAALTAAEGLTGEGRGSSGVQVFEKKQRPGRKLLLSGAGQCNVTHTGTPEDFLEHYGNRDLTRRFMKKILYACPPQYLLSYLGKAGIEVCDNGEGKLFPASGRALDILNVLVNDLERRGAVLSAGGSVANLERQDGVFLLRLEDGSIVKAEKVILASGGCSYPQTGSTGDGYSWAAALGHRITTPRPGLTGIMADAPGLSALAGLSFPEAGITLYRDSRKLLNRTGALLITHRGFSGPLILNGSRYVLPGDRMVIDFTGQAREYRLEVEKLMEREGKRSLAKILAQSGLPRRLVDWSLRCAGIEGNRKAAEVSGKAVSAVLNSLTAEPFTVTGLGGWDEAMVTAGGVDLSEVNPGTLESRIVPGLYFAGEVLDVDGDTGGYNLQAAFSTGFLAGFSAAAAVDRDISIPQDEKETN